MNEIAATLAIRTRLRQRALPTGELWRRLGEYGAGEPCDGCGEHITSAQASYAVDFAPGVAPQSARFHRVCFEIWQCECDRATAVARGGPHLAFPWRPSAGDME